MLAMMMALVLGLGLLGAGPPWTTSRNYNVEGWSVQVRHDKFAGAVTCSLHSHQVVLLRDTLIFPLGPEAQTADAIFRVDNGPARSVRQALALDEARGFFPDRGWVENPDETQVALPASYALGARVIWIRANARAYPTRFKVGGLAAALRTAQAKGCPLQRI